MAEPKPKTCGGACCRRFILQQSPEELKMEYEAWLRSGPNSPFHYTGMTGERRESRFGPSADNNYVSIHDEIYLLYPMLIYLGHHNWEPCDPKRKRHKVKSHHYTCKHHNTKTGLCTIYEFRPFMCRHYPNGHSCPFPDCKLPGNKEKRKEEQRQIVEAPVVRKLRRGKRQYLPAFPEEK
jgi:Fe-S-cluster containining protein